MTIRATTLAAEELRKVYEAGGPILGLHSRADIGVLLAEITALHADARAITDRAEAAEERARKAEARARFAWTCLRAPTPEGCINCGRLVLAGGPCCDKPEFPPWPPPVAELARMYSKTELALRNVLALSRRLWKRGQLSDEDAGHFARFCESAGVEPSILRGEDDG